MSRDLAHVCIHHHRRRDDVDGRHGACCRRGTAAAAARGVLAGRRRVLRRPRPDTHRRARRSRALPGDRLPDRRRDDAPHHVPLENRVGRPDRRHGRRHRRQRRCARWRLAAAAPRSRVGRIGRRVRSVGQPRRRRHERSRDRSAREPGPHAWVRRRLNGLRGPRWSRPAPVPRRRQRGSQHARRRSCRSPTP